MDASRSHGLPGVFIVLEGGDGVGHERLSTMDVVLWRIMPT